MIKIVRLIGFFILVVILITGCSSSLMIKIDDDLAYEPVPKDGKALIVFLRPSYFGGGIQSSIFELKENVNTFVGIVSTQTKVAYQIDPGEYIFMVISENADFSYVNAAAGKTYYILVTPRFGAWKARFSLKPIHKDELNSDQFADWYNSCSWVENTELSYEWAVRNAASIQAKRKKYMVSWMKKPKADRPVLNPEDGK